MDASWNAWFSKRRLLRAGLRMLRAAPKAALDLDWDPGVVVHNVGRGLPFSSDSLTAIYSSHMLEHLHHRQAEQLLDECHRVLEPGGILRIVVPDLRALVREYLEHIDSQEGEAASKLAPLPADVLNDRLLFRHRSAPDGGILFKWYTLLNDFHTHKWMYDRDSLTAQFAKARFRDVRPMNAHESRIPDIQGVETFGRVSEAGVCVEGVKPAGPAQNP